MISSAFVSSGEAQQLALRIREGCATWAVRVRQAWVRGPRAHAVGVATGNPLNSLIFSIGRPSEDSKIIDTRLFQLTIVIALLNSYHLGMYLRVTERRDRDGPSIAYYALAENVWNAAAKRSEVRVVHSFGRADRIDKAALQRLVASINRVIDAADALP